MITPATNRELRLVDVPRAVRRAGFVPAEMRIRARGAYELHQGSVAFRIRGWRDAIPVELAGAEPPSGEILLRARVDHSGIDIALVPVADG